MPPSTANAGRCARSRASSMPRPSARSRSSVRTRRSSSNLIYTNPWQKLGVGRCRYGVMLREDGFIYDDGVVGRIAEDRFHVTTTTGGAPRVLQHMEDYLQTEFPHLKVWLTSTSEQWAVIAVQGPKAREIIAPLVEGIDLSKEAMPHMSVREGRICGVPTRLFRDVVHRRARLRDQRAGRLRPCRLGGDLEARRADGRLRLRHRDDACAARREGLHHRRPGNRRDSDAARCRAVLGDRQEEDRFRRHARAEAAGSRRRRAASSSWA